MLYWLLERLVRLDAWLREHERRRVEELYRHPLDPPGIIEHEVARGRPNGGSSR
jgi:hypothetical protein